MAYFNYFKKAFKSILIIFTACIGIGFLLYFYTSKILLRTTADSLEEMAKLGAIIVEKEIHRRLQSLETISKTNAIRNPNLSLKDKAVYLNNYLTEDFIRITISDSQGNACTSDGNTINIADREHFRKAVSGEKNVSDPIASKIGSEMVVVFAVPVYVNNEITGILCGVYKGEELSKITDGFRLGEGGNSFIINKFGEVIAHDDRSLVFQRFNPILGAKKDPALKELAGLIEQMTQGKTGAGSYRFLGAGKYLSFAPIKGTDWSLAVAAPKSQIFQDINQLLFFLTASFLIICIVIVILNLYLGYLQRRITRERKLSGNVIEMANLIIIKYDSDGNILDFNKFAELKTGFVKAEVIGRMNISDLIVLDHKDGLALLEALSSGACPQKLELAFTTKTDGILYLIGHCNCPNLKSTDQREYELLGMDITEMVEAEKQLRKSHEQLAALNEEITASEEELRANFEDLFESQQQLRESEERYSLVVDAAGIGIWAWDSLTKRWFFSSECRKILEIDPHSVQEYFREIQRRIHPDDSGDVVKTWKEYQNVKTGHFEIEHRIVLPNGEVRWVHALIKAVRKMDGNIIRMAGSYLDITKLKEYQEQLQYLAYHDVLTGLPNRLMLHSYWNENLAGCKEQKTAIFFLDIDDFKLINDTLGHNFGDQLIVAIGSRLQSLLGRGSMVFRIGGDEFIIFRSCSTEISEVEAVATKILRSFTEPFELENKRVHVTGSIGITIYPDHAVETVDLLKNADIAMFKAKELGRNRYVIFDPGLQMVIDERVQLEKNLRDALNKEEFHLYYQPQIDPRTGRVGGFEALLRWVSPELGMVSPLKFIRITEETGMIVQLGAWVLEQACSFLKRLQLNTGANFLVSINVSIIQLMQDNFVRQVLETLDKYQVNPELIELEITESILIESFDTIYQKLNSLRESRVRIALDDFGKGYSSLNYLCQLPISTLKIDKSFIDNIMDVNKERIITGDIVAIGRKIGLAVVAEGVETREQVDYLLNHGCDKIQGYFYSEPIPEEKVVAFLKKRSASE